METADQIDELLSAFESLKIPRTHVTTGLSKPYCQQQAIPQSIRQSEIARCGLVRRPNYESDLYVVDARCE